MDKKEYNKQYFQENKERIYTNYKKRYDNGNCVLNHLNWYLKRKCKKAPQHVISQILEDVDKPRTVDIIEVKFWFD